MLGKMTLPAPRWSLPVAIVLTVAAGLVLRLAAYTLWDIHHADEFTQYLEQGHRLAEGYGLVPWESRYGIRNALIPQFLAGWIALGATLDPAGLLPLELARAAYLLLCLSVLAGAWGIGAVRSWRHGLLALVVTATWHESVLFGTVLLSESLATALLVCGAALLGAGRLRLAGFVLALGVLVRVQYAPFAAVLALLTLRLEWRQWGQLVLGGLIALALGAVSDLADGRAPFVWIVNNFTFNIAAGRAARFGLEGPFYYWQQLLASLGPFAPAMLLGALLCPPRHRPLLAALTVNLIFHSVIGHKEYRFVWLSSLLIVLLAALASLDLIERLAPNRRGWGTVLLAGLLWLGNSALAGQVNGGARTFKGGGAVTRTLHRAGQRAEVCGIAVPNQWRNHTITAFLRRDVPLYVAPDGVLAGTEPLPAPIAAGANALIAGSRPAGAAAYRLMSCEHRQTVRACLYLRPGGCDRARAMAYDYQTLLIRNDL